MTKERIFNRLATICNLIDELEKECGAFQENCDAIHHEVLQMARKTDELGTLKLAMEVVRLHNIN